MKRTLQIGLRFIVICLLIVAVACAKTSQPDVLLLVVDTLRADHLSLYGYERPTSPALDRFASTAMVFADVFAPAPWTLPSVGSLLTGTYPSLHGLRVREGASELESLRPGFTTLAEVLRERGYRTVALITNPWVISRAHGLDVGFDEYRSALGADADAIHRMAQEVMEGNDERPLFLYLHYMDVHGPYARQTPADPDLGAIPSRYQRALGSLDVERIPRYLRLPEVRDLGEYVNAYDVGIRRWDRSFGNFVEWLQSRGRLDRSVITVVSDHGEEFLEHGGWNHGETLYQDQLFVPWILHIPGVKGRWIRDRLASLIDVAPTLLGSVGAPIPSSMAGRNLVAETEEPEARALFAETDVRLGGIPDLSRAQVAMREGRVKWIAGSSEAVCFDLERDPDEQAPMAGDTECGSTAFEELERWVREARLAAQSFGESKVHELSPEEIERLRALGYVE